MQKLSFEPEGGHPRINHAAVAIGDNVFTFGGLEEDKGKLTRSAIEVHVLNTATFIWTEILTNEEAEHKEECPSQSYGHTVSAISKNILFWGGRREDGNSNTLYCFDITTNQWSKPVVRGDLPGPRHGHSACIVKENMYVFGGYNDKDNMMPHDLYALDLGVMMWVVLHPEGALPAWREYHSAVGIGNTMYVYGGRTSQDGKVDYPDHIQAYNTVGNAWLDIPNAEETPVGRHCHSAVALGGHMYVLGGYDSETDTHFQDVYKYVPRENRWTLVEISGEEFAAQRGQVSCVVGTKVFIFGGASPVVPDNDDTATIEEEPSLHVNSDLLILEIGPQSRKVEDMESFIKPHREMLINNIDLSNLLPNLYAYRLLNKHEKEVIESKRNRQMKCTSLVEALIRRPATQIQLLCAVLKGSKNETLADLLTSEVEEQNARLKKRRMKNSR